MRPFLTSPRKLVDLVILFILSGLLFFLHRFETALLFSFGFIWNWVASQDLSQMMEGKSYKYTMLRFVQNSFSFVLSPEFIKKSPEFVKLLVRVIPAGTFWSLLIWVQDSDLPWWATFVGSLAFELSQLDVILKRKGQVT